MWALVIILLLPFIFILAGLGAPFLYVGGRTIMFAEQLRAEYGGVAEFGFMVLLIWLVIFTVWYKRVFAIPLIIVLGIATWLGGP